MIHSGWVPVNIRLGWKGLTMINTSLLQKIVNYKPKGFITLAPQQRKTRKNMASYKKYFTKKHSSLVAQECE
jgi:hypothetical protein